jgi:hypothetical protein
LLFSSIAGGSPTWGKPKEEPLVLHDPVIVFEDTSTDTATPKELFVDCPDGKEAISGGVGIKDLNAKHSASHS